MCEVGLFGIPTIFFFLDIGENMQRTGQWRRHAKGKHASSELFYIILTIIMAGYIHET